MKVQEKRNILILIVIGILIIGMLAIIREKKMQERNRETIEEIEQTVQELASGTKLNVSEKLAEKKYFDNFEASNIQLIEKDGITKLSADVTNTSTQKIEFLLLEITFLDKKGKELTTVRDALIMGIEPEGKTKLNISTTSKCVNAYDFSIKITKQKGL